MKQPTFKPFTEADADIVMDMMHDFYAIDNYAFDKVVSKGLFLEFVANKGLGQGWVIELNGQPVGYAILTFVFNFEYKGHIAFLDELFIIESARGEGLGSQTLDFVIAQAKELSLKVLYLEIENHNEAARKLYSSKKFTNHKRGMMKLVVE
jgi:GNAT superfamily N-acetyltransferase